MITDQQTTTGGDRAGIDLATADRQQLECYLAGRGIKITGNPERLTGGVSGTVIKITTDDGPLIAKQALAELATPGQWRADRRRTRTEGRAIALLHRLTPEHTAELVDLDTDELVVIMSCAPARWSPWKEQLLSSSAPAVAETTVAAALGTLLARWHEAVGSADLETFDDHETFRALRSDPFYRGPAAAHPRLADRLGLLADDLDRARGCLMHGDFSPKNVLADPKTPGRLWVVDHEAIVDGTPVFDVAFMLSHLGCKAVRSPAGPLLDASAAFCSAYRTTGRRLRTADLAAHTAALMLARVDGVSRVGYLSAAEQDLVRDAAVAVLTTARPTVEQLWNRIAEGEKR